MKGRKILFTSKGIAECQPFDVPMPNPNEVLIETDYTVVSAGTERACLLNLPNVSHSWPKMLGYSGSGHIISVGCEVTEFKIGDRVLTDHLGHCSHTLATFQKNRDGFFPINEDVTQLEAAFVVIGSMGVQGARKTKLQLGESAMVTGLGILGLFAVQALSAMGGLPVIAVDFEESRRNVALELGADYALSPAQPNFFEQVQELTRNRMINANVEVTGSSKALVQALEVAAWEGRIALTGCTRVSDTPIDFYRQVHKPGIQIIGAHNHVRPQEDSYEGYWTRHDDFSMLLRMLSMGKMNVQPILSEIVSPAKATKLYKKLSEDTNFPLGIAFDWHQ